MAGASVVIRKAALLDLSLIVELIQIGADEDGTVLNRSQEEIAAIIECFWVAELEGRVVGCISLERYATILNGGRIIDSGRLAEIRSLVVHPSCRGRRIGADLIAVCVAEAERLGILSLMAVTGKDRLFGRFGFANLLSDQLILHRRRRPD